MGDVIQVIGQLVWLYWCLGSVWDIPVFGKWVGSFRCLGSGRCHSVDWAVDGSFVCLGIGFGYGDVSDWEVDGCMNPL